MSVDGTLAFEESPQKKVLIKIEWWVWPILLLTLVAISYGSYFLRNFTDSVLLYLPTPFAFVLIYWFGPRTLPLIYINEIITLILWGALGPWYRILLLASHVPVMAFTSWYLFKSVSKESNEKMLTSTNSFIRFTLFGVFIPVSINTVYTYNYSFVDGDLYTVGLIFLADFLTVITIATPILYFFAPGSKSFRLTRTKQLTSSNFLPYHLKRAIGLSVIISVFVVMIFFVDFDSYWFVYGVVSIIVAIQRGFAGVLVINVAIFVLNYILPTLDFADELLASKGSTKLLGVHLGMATMILSSSLIGRVISDLWKIEYKLSTQKRQLEATNDELVKTNSELDRFVYSLSHDISAPLKSIKGLINLSKIDKSESLNELYLSKIEGSVNRLDSFVKEVLDYSRTNRSQVEKEVVELRILTNEIIDGFRYLENFQNIEFSTHFKVPSIYTDKFLFKVAFANVISNAIKYQKTGSDHKAFIEVTSMLKADVLQVSVSDNGEGISEEHQDQIFEMFYRGSDTSTGSGLGLYIARESIEKLGGTIKIESTKNQGATFTISFPHTALPAEV